MKILLLVVLLILLFGGGGWGLHSGYWAGGGAGPYAFGGIGFVILVVVVLALLGVF